MRNEKQEGDFNPNWTSPPGDTISRVMGDLKLSIDEFSLQMDLTVTYVTLLLCGDLSISSKVASKLAEVTSTKSTFWLKRDQNYQKDLKRLDLRVKKYIGIHNKMLLARTNEEFVMTYIVI